MLFGNGKFRFTTIETYYEVREYQDGSLIHVFQFWKMDVDFGPKVSLFERPARITSHEHPLMVKEKYLVALVFVASKVIWLVR